jgi:hypothetical protein
MRLQDNLSLRPSHVPSARNQNAIVHRRLQLENNTHIDPFLEQTPDTCFLTPDRPQILMAIDGVVSCCRSPCDIAVADHEVIPGQVISTALHHQPRQTNGRVNRLRNGPVLQTVTVVSLVQLHVERHLSGAHHVANAGNRRVPFIGGVPGDVWQTHKHSSANEAVQDRGNSHPLSIARLHKASLDPNVSLCLVCEHVNHVTYIPVKIIGDVSTVYWGRRHGRERGRKGGRNNSRRRSRN